jgi:hypothetical protein
MSCMDSTGIVWDLEAIPDMKVAGLRDHDSKT